MAGSLNINKLGKSQNQRSSSLAQGEQDSAERRRAQQRLAQRAYRIRKEDDVKRLRKRIDELEEAGDKTSKAILTLCDKLLETDLGQHRPDVLPALRDCLSLAKSGNQESKTADSESWNEEQQQISTFTNVASQLKQVLENVQMPQQKPNALVSDNASSPQVFPALVTKSSPDRDHPRFNFQLPISYPISSFISYKGESIFAQSLLQACFRNGYQLLTNASAKLDDIKQVFGSLLTKADRHMMVIFLGHSISSFDTHPPPVFHNDAVFHNYGEMRHKEILQYYSQDPWEFSDSMPLEQEMIDRYAVQKMLRERGVAIDDDISSFPIQSPFGSYIFDVRCFIAFLSQLPICVGNGNIVFPRHRFETAFQLALEN